MTARRVIIESPYAGDVEANIEYALDILPRLKAGDSC